MATVNGRTRVWAAQIAGESAEMGRAAGRVRARIMAEASRHNLTSAFMNSWNIKSAPGLSGTGRSVQDRLVYSTDPGALAINYGHIAGKRPHKESQRVPGKYIVEKAIGRK